MANSVRLNLYTDLAPHQHRGLTGAVTLVQARMQQTFDLSRSAAERHHADHTKRREELVEVYTRYQLAADRLENAIRELTASGREPFETAQAAYDVAARC